LAAQLLTEPVIRAIDANGLAISGAKLHFYLTGTTTPAAAYTSAALSTQHANPVVSDSGGLFAPIYLDPAVSYRVQLKTSAGALIEDIDPISFSSPSEATLAEVNAGVVTGKFVSPARLAGWTGISTALGYTPVNRAGDTATALNITPAASPATNAAGFLGLPVVTLNAASNLSNAHNGRMLRHTDSTAYAWTIPTSASAGWVLNTAIAIRNVGSGAITVTPASGVVLRKGGSSIDGSVSVGQWGFAFLAMEADNVWLIQGSGLS
jgi:hypothetical protein